MMKRKIKHSCYRMNVHVITMSGEREREREREREYCEIIQGVGPNVRG